MNPKDECQMLLDKILPMAEMLLLKHKEFYPIGAVMNNNGEIEITTVDVLEKHPETQGIIDKLKVTHKKLAGQGKIKVSGIMWDATVHRDGEKKDAVIVSMEHRDQYSVVVYEPYSISPLRNVIFSEVFATKGKKYIFDEKSSKC